MSERNPDSGQARAMLTAWEAQQLRAEILYSDCRNAARQAIIRAKIARAQGHGWRARKWTNSALDWHALSLDVPRARG